MNFLKDIGIALPIIQAPMAGVSTPELAAAVSNAGALGSIGIGAADAAGAHKMITELQGRTDAPFNVNLFVHASPIADRVRERRWLDALTPAFEGFNVQPPEHLRTIYTSFNEDDDMLAMLLRTRPAIVSFHFGLPRAAKISALKNAGCYLLASATCLEEAEAAQSAGINAIIAQGYEAGGHRGVFNPSIPDAELGTFALTQLLISRLSVPVISAGGLMDGRGIAAVLALGAQAAQMGTAFVACPESSADAAYRKALTGRGAYHTVMTDAVSGRPARCLANRFTEWAQANPDIVPPDYPLAYDAGKALHGAGKAAGDSGFGAQWAGQGAPLARSLPAAELIEKLTLELEETRLKGV
ncbi:MAG: nitronate monooxygenase [Pseudomonadota bacterium]